MKKVILTECLFVVLFLLLIIPLFARKKIQDISFEALEEAFLLCPGSEGLEKQSLLVLRREFGLDETAAEEVLYFASKETMSVDVFLVMKVSGPGSKEKAAEALKAYVAGQLRNFEGYGEKQVKLLSDALYYEAGGYEALMISENAESWLQLLKSMTEG